MTEWVPHSLTSVDLSHVLLLPILADAAFPHSWRRSTPITTLDPSSGIPSAIFWHRRTLITAMGLHLAFATLGCWRRVPASQSGERPGEAYTLVIRLRWHLKVEPSSAVDPLLDASAGSSPQWIPPQAFPQFGSRRNLITAMYPSDDFFPHYWASADTLTSVDRGPFR